MPTMSSSGMRHTSLRLCGMSSAVGWPPTRADLGGETVPAILRRATLSTAIKIYLKAADGDSVRVLESNQKA